jgi:hypothetical protein
MEFLNPRTSLLSQIHRLIPTHSTGRPSGHLLFGCVGCNAPTAQRKHTSTVTLPIRISVNPITSLCMADDLDSTFRLHTNKETKMTSVVQISETGEERSLSLSSSLSVNFSLLTLVAKELTTSAVPSQVLSERVERESSWATTL